MSAYIQLGSFAKAIFVIARGALLRTFTGRHTASGYASSGVGLVVYSYNVGENNRVKRRERAVRHALDQRRTAGSGGGEGGGGGGLEALQLPGWAGWLAATLRQCQFRCRPTHKENQGPSPEKEGGRADEGAANRGSGLPWPSSM